MRLPKEYKMACIMSVSRNKKTLFLVLIFGSGAEMQQQMNFAGRDFRQVYLPIGPIFRAVAA